jgi:probable rRNA maturation factor
VKGLNSTFRDPNSPLRTPHSALRTENRQRARPVDLHYLRAIVRTLLEKVLAILDYDLAVHLVAAPEMTRLNETFLQHEGPTDVITFDYCGQAPPASRLSRPRSTPHAPRPPLRPPLHGEIFICLNEALTQAQRFRTTWQSELLRYLIHGILHLQGFDDLRSRDRRTMKREESRLLRLCSRQFDLQKLAKG